MVAGNWKMNKNLQEGVALATELKEAVKNPACAVVIGTAIFSKVSPNFLVRLLSVGVGSIIYYIVYQTVVFIGLDTDLLKMLAAVIVALFLGIPYLRKTIIPKVKKWKKNKELLKEGNSL